MTKAEQYLKEALDKFSQLSELEARQNAEVKTIGKALSPPTILHGQAQVPILGTKAFIEAANAMLDRHGAESEALASPSVWAVFFSAIDAANETLPKGN